MNQRNNQSIDPIDTTEWTSTDQSGQPDQPNRSPLDELKYQYAAGELSEAEFERKLDRLIDTETLTADSEREFRERSVDVDEPN